LDLWDTFSSELDPAAAKPATVLRFFYQVTKYVSSEVEKNKAIYKSNQETYLFSMGDQLVVGDLSIGSMIHLDMIVRYVDKHLSQFPLCTVLELGCGTGVNLFHLYHYLDIDRIVGGDICPNAVALATRISQKLGIPGNFQQFDYRDSASLAGITQGLEQYLLLTCHSIEQTQVSEIGFIENVLNLLEPPGLVIHCEPIVWDDQTLMGRLCRRYAEKNDYNLDLLETLLKYQDENRLTIVDYQKRCFGISAFNPTSFLCWKPLHTS